MSWICGQQLTSEEQPECFRKALYHGCFLFSFFSLFVIFLRRLRWCCCCWIVHHIFLSLFVCRLTKTQHNVCIAIAKILAPSPIYPRPHVDHQSTSSSSCRLAVCLVTRWVAHKIPIDKILLLRPFFSSNCRTQIPRSFRPPTLAPKIPAPSSAERILVCVCWWFFCATVQK